MPKLNLTFDAGAPLDASKLQQLVTYLNELDSQTLKLTSEVGNLANKNVALRLISGTHSAGTINHSGSAVPVEVTFSNGKTLITEPSAILVTIETSTTNADMTYYLKSTSQSGFTVMINRVSGVNSKSASTVSTTQFQNVKIHYLALAKLDI